MITATNNETEAYTISLITEELGEVMEIGGRLLQMLGKAGRFGIDTPGVKDPLTGRVDMSVTPRQQIAKESGDFMAAIHYAAVRGVLDGAVVSNQMAHKLAKLTNPESKDNLGRRLAP